MTDRNNRNVHHVPAYAYDYPYWVVSIVDGEAWFYGAFPTFERASFSANAIGGQIIGNN